MNAILLDIRYGLRQFARQRGSSIVAVLTLALGIGVSTAIFSIIDATMLRPLPYDHPEQLVAVWVEELLPNGKTWSPSASMADLRFWQAADDVFSSVAGSGSAYSGRITDGPEPERIRVRHFTEDYLPMHGVTLALGRGFRRDDVAANAPIVALLGYGYWQTRFGGRANVLGEAIRLDDQVATIVGVLPSWFERTTQLVTPLQIPAKEFDRRGTGRVYVEARLRPDVTVAQATERLAARMIGVAGSQPGVKVVRARVISRLDELTNGYRTTVNILAGAVGLIVLLAAVNVAGLLLARGAARQSELAVRASLGAGRSRLIRQLMSETLVLVVPAMALGVFLAWLALDALVANIPLTMPANTAVDVNLTSMAMTVAVLLTASLIFAVLPAIRLSRVRIGPVMARSAHVVGSALSRRGGQVMIAAEVALAVVLVTGAGLMIRSFMRISAVDLGFKPDGLVTMEVLPLERTPSAQEDYYWALLERLRQVPGIESVSIVDNFALAGGTMYSSVSVNGKFHQSTMFEVTPGYFETIGATLREGRWPADADRASRLCAVVINQSAARAMFPERSPIGQSLAPRAQPNRPCAVVGVVADLRHGGPLEVRDRGRAQVFFPLHPDEHSLTDAMMVVARPSGDARGLGDRLRQTAQSLGPRVLIERIRGADELFGERVITPKRRTVLFGLLGASGLILALVGIFGMTAYAVTRRTAEIGVRMAFGATERQAVATVLRDAAIPIVAGTLLGVAAAASASRVIESFLFETAPADPATLATVAIALTIAGCLAALVPALRAARVDPATSLRVE